LETAYSGSGANLGHEEHRQQEVPDVVGPERELEPLLGCPTRPRDARVVEEHVDRAAHRVDTRCARAHRVEVAEIQGDELRVARAEGTDLFEHRARLVFRPACEDQRGPTLREAQGGRPADARVRAGDDDETLVEIALRVGHAPTLPESGRRGA